MYGPIEEACGHCTYIHVAGLSGRLAIRPLIRPPSRISDQRRTLSPLSPKLEQVRAYSSQTPFFLSGCHIYAGIWGQ
jgi:hypothetical protein